MSIQRREQEKRQGGVCLLPNLTRLVDVVGSGNGATAQPVRTVDVPELKAVLLQYDARQGGFSNNWSKNPAITSEVVANDPSIVSAAKKLKTSFKFPFKYWKQTHNMNTFRFWKSTTVLDAEVLRDAIQKATQLCIDRLGDKQQYTDSGYYLKRDLRGKRLLIIGDTHGSLHSLAQILEHVEKSHFQTDGATLKTDVHLIMTGDVLDRSPYALETMWLFLKLYIQNPHSVTLLGGNHEMDATGQWTKHNGTDNEMQGEYGEEGIPKLLVEMFHAFPHSLIAFTDLGVVQFNHGAVEYDVWKNVLPVLDQGKKESFKEFCSFNENSPPEDPSHVEVHPLLGERVGNPLVWSDVVQSGKPYDEQEFWKMRSPIFSVQLEEYMDALRIKHLVRGHNDAANLSILFANPSSSDTAKTLKELNKQGMGPFPGHAAYPSMPDDRSDDAATGRWVKHGSFVFGPQLLSGKRLYPLYSLVVAQNTGDFEKTLIMQGRRGSSDRKDHILAITTSSAPFAKYIPPTQTMSSYLVLEKTALADLPDASLISIR